MALRLVIINSSAHDIIESLEYPKVCVYFVLIADLRIERINFNTELVKETKSPHMGTYIFIGHALSTISLNQTSETTKGRRLRALHTKTFEAKYSTEKIMATDFVDYQSLILINIYLG